MWSLRQADVVVPIGINRLALSPCWSNRHTDMLCCLGDFGIAERALPHRVFGTRAIFLLLFTLHKLLIMQPFFNLLLFLLSSACTIFCAQVNDPGRAALSPRCTDVPRHLGWTGGFIITSLTHAGDFGVTLSACIGRAMSPLRSVELFAPPPRDRLGGWNLVPHQARTASSMPNTLTS